MKGSEIFHIARERQGSDRAAYLREACGQDETLRREVESLLAADEKALTIERFAPRQLSRYRILNKIGAGGMGEVYLAEDETLGRQVAVKVLAPELATDADRIARFRREARAVANLDHPNIITIHDYGVDDGHHFFVTEYVAGTTLRELVRAGRTQEQVLPLLIPIAKALAAAHAQSIVHRDIKPENILVTTDGRVKVADFGIAKLLPAARVISGNDGVTPTQFGAIIGTVAYMAPEQIRGEEIDGRADVFSLGVVLYELLVGRRPFDGATVQDTMAAILVNEPPQIAPSIATPPLARLVSSMLAKDRNARPSSADVVGELQSLADRHQTMQDVLDALRDSPPSGDMARRSRHIRGPKQIASVAVLPFVNESNDSESEYLADGITETLINSLSQIPKLRVVPRNTVFRYRNRDDVTTVARELAVRAVLIGRVSHRGERIVVSTELIDAENDAQLWGDQYSRAVSDLLDLHQAIAADIASHLRPKLSGHTRKRVVTAHTDDPEAYRLYLKGRYELNKRSSESLRRSIDFFQRAIERDPAYARGYAGLADAWVLLGWYALERPRVAFPRALSAARQAVDIDPTYGEAQTSMAYAKLLAEWDAAEAERMFQEAILRNPGYAFAHHWYADLLQATGRAAEAIVQATRACEIDPLALILNAELGRAFYYNGEFERAVEQQKRVLDLEPHFVPSLLFLGQAYDQCGRLDEAIDAFRTGVTQSERNPIYRGYLGYALARAGDAAAAREILDELKKDAAEQWIPAFALGLIAIAMENWSDAEQSLMLALEERSHWLLYAHVDPAFASLWRVERFDSIRREIGAKKH